MQNTPNNNETNSVEYRFNETLVNISTQRYENYNDSGEGKPYWKPKGEQIFTLRADSDCFFYGEDIAIAAIKSLLEEHSNDHFKFMYVSHEVIFSEPIELKGFEHRYETFVELAKASRIANQ
jgi:hypothetical protein